MDEVVERMQNSDSEDAVSENDDSEDDFDGYLEEMDIDGWWNRREMDSNSDEEGNSDDKSNNDEDLDNSDQNLNNEEEMEQDVPPIPLYTMASGCSATLAGNAPIDYFSLFVDERMLQHIVEQTILNSKQFMESHTLGQRSRIRQWLKEEHTIAELRRFLALIIVMGIVRYPQIESHWSTSWPYATDAFSSVSSFLYKHVHGLKTVLLSTGHDKRSILPTDEISSSE